MANLPWHGNGGHTGRRRRPVPSTSILHARFLRRRRPRADLVPEAPADRSDSPPAASLPGTTGRWRAIPSHGAPRPSTCTKTVVTVRYDCNARPVPRRRCTSQQCCQK